MRRSSMHRSKNSITGLVVLFVLAIVVFFGFNGCATSVAQMNTHEEVSTVCSKESVQTGSGDNRSHEYRVYTSGSTYVVEDYYGIGGCASVALTCTVTSRSARPTSSGPTDTESPGHHLSGTLKASPPHSRSLPAPAANATELTAAEFGGLSPSYIFSCLSVRSIDACLC